MRCRIACAAGVCALPVPKNCSASFTGRSSTSAMFSARRAVYSSTAAPENRLPFTVLANRADAGHHREVRVDHAGAVAGRARALGVRAEERGLDAVRLRERGADRIEHTGVRRRIAPARSADGGLVDGDDAFPAADRLVNQRALARPGDAGHDHEHAERDVHVHILQIVACGRRGPSSRPSACARTT